MNDRDMTEILSAVGQTAVSRAKASGNPYAVANQLGGLLSAMDKAHQKQALNHLETEVELARLDSVLGGGRTELPWAAQHERLVSTIGKEQADLISKYRTDLKSLSGTPYQKKLKELKGLIHRIGRKYQEGARAALSQGERVERFKRCAAEIDLWLKEPLILQRLETSHLGQIRRDELNRDVFSTYHRGQETFPNDLIDRTYGDAQAFVVEHDWARAFETAPEVFTDAVKLPSDACAFEFCVSGKVVVSFVIACDDYPMMMTMVRAKEGWIMFGNVVSRRGQLGYVHTDKGYADGITTFEAGESILGHFIPLTSDQAVLPLATMVDRQIRAICIALDSQVATKTAVRMPYRSNMPKGEKAAKPFYSYHTVSLARRAARLDAPPESDHIAQGPKRRLHFRRGHWRHLDGWKTWVNWCLVGDPDLGFVDKHYKL